MRSDFYCITYKGSDYDSNGSGDDGGAGATCRGHKRSLFNFLNLSNKTRK